jgi:DNA-binding beta-propeller fold protein YncE
MSNRNYDLTRRSLLAHGVTLLAAAAGTACADTGPLSAGTTPSPRSSGQATLSHSGNTLTVVSDSGKQLWRLDAFGTGVGELNGAMDSRISGNRVLVANSGNGRVDVFDLNGRYAGALSVPNHAPPFFRPVAIAENAQGIYIADSMSHAIYRFDASLNFVETLGTGELNGPSHLTTTSDAELLVLDRGNHRILKIDGKNRLTPIAQPFVEFPSEFQTFADGSVAVYDLHTHRAHPIGFTQHAQA